MNSGISLNRKWYFAEGFDRRIIEEPLENADGRYMKINVPHTVREVPYDCFDQTMTCMISTYIRKLNLPALQGRRALLYFEGVSAFYELYVNGKKAGEHRGAYSTALFDVTDLVRPGANRIVLMVDSHERDDIPPNGSTVDYLIYGGIYRDVTLYLKQPVYLRQTLVRYDLSLSGADGKAHSVRTGSLTLYPELLLQNETGEAHTLTVRQRLLDGDTERFRDEQVITVSPGFSHVTLEKRFAGTVRLWSPEHPCTYREEISLYDRGGISAKENASACLSEENRIDQDSYPVGFRTIRVTPDGFCLNGEKILLTGLNRHQSYPYAGYALGRRSQEKDAEILRSFLGLNIVRCSHYMQSRYFLDRCDTLGLMVFEEIPGWGFIGGETFRGVVKQDLRNMVLEHFNHPSIVIWGTRLNETKDDDALYGETNRLCKELDPSRPTSGVRYETGSHLIEDIYSYNDYSEDEKGEFVLLTSHQARENPEPAPYLISEHTGAILPTKPWDSEERQEQFALRHAKVLSKIRTTPGYLGAIGWCMCDYNTHNDHNSLEKICYHGVLDMFRVPKMAAYVYASQKDPSEEIILEPCSMVGRGERCEPVPFWVLTNCDYITVKLSEDKTRFYYPSMKFSGMKHPPVEVKVNGEFWQHRWTGAVITGYVNGQKAAERVYSSNPYLADLDVQSDSSELSSSEPDETRITAFFRDENGNRLWFHRGYIRVSCEGDIELIGPDIIPAMGGAAAFWVRSLASGRSGEGRVRITCDRKALGEKRQILRLI